MQYDKAPLQVLVACSIKSPAPAARVLVLTTNAGANDNNATLVVPEEEIARSLQTDIDAFFLGLQQQSGYYLITHPVISSNPGWRKIASYLQNSPLSDLHQLLQTLFPTLRASSYYDLLSAFRLHAETPALENVAALMDIVHQRLASLPRRVKRELKRLAAATTEPIGKLIVNLTTKETTAQFSIDENRFANLDRFENLTDGVDIRPDDLSEIFNGGSKLAALIPNFSLRAGQAQYANAIKQVLANDELLLAEAATGTGKSIGYLLPLIAHCFHTASRAAIVTRTRSLQEQLFWADLQKLKKIIPPGFKVALLKGLRNYLCIFKYKIFLSDFDLFKGHLETQKLMALIIWESETNSGDLSETLLLTDPELEELEKKITLDEESCLGPNCQFYNDCYGYNARRKALRSELVVTNYALLFSDLIAGRSILGRLNYAVFDEGHRLEAEAIAAFSFTCGCLQFQRSLQRLTTSNFKNLLAGLLQNSKESENYSDQIKTIIADLPEKLQVLAAELTAVRRRLRPQTDRIRFQPNDAFYTLLVKFCRNKNERLNQICDLLGNLLEQLQTKQEGEKSEHLPELRRFLSGVVAKITALSQIENHEASKLVVWGQFYESGEVVIVGAPLEVGELLSQELYSRYQSTIITSATLDCEDQFEAIKKRLGLTAEYQREPRQIQIASPFPLQEQLRVCLARYLPPPNVPDYFMRVAQLITGISAKIKLPTLVLCTSYRAIETIAAEISRERKQAAELLVQKAEISAQSTLAQFRQGHRRILIGTETFWEGVDLPNDLLRILILTRLPFPVPDDPLEEARSQQAEIRGENPFMTLSIPAAVLRFRQGIGRMIRNASDWGIVIITDSRMARKRYGQVFFSATPVPIECYDYQSQLIKENIDWLLEMNREN